MRLSSIPLPDLLGNYIALVKGDMPNWSQFVREAITEKLEREGWEGVPSPNMKIGRPSKNG